MALQRASLALLQGQHLADAEVDAVIHLFGDINDPTRAPPVLRVAGAAQRPDTGCGRRRAHPRRILVDRGGSGDRQVLQVLRRARPRELDLRHRLEPRRPHRCAARCRRDDGRRRDRRWCRRAGPRHRGAGRGGAAGQPGHRTDRGRLPGRRRGVRPPGPTSTTTGTTSRTASRRRTTGPATSSATSTTRWRRRSTRRRTVVEKTSAEEHSRHLGGLFEAAGARARQARPPQQDQRDDEHRRRRDRAGVTSGAGMPGEPSPPSSWTLTDEAGPPSMARKSVAPRDWYAADEPRRSASSLARSRRAGLAARGWAVADPDADLSLRPRPAPRRARCRRRSSLRRSVATWIVRRPRQKDAAGARSRVSVDLPEGPRRLARGSGEHRRPAPLLDAAGSRRGQRDRPVGRPRRRPTPTSPGSRPCTTRPPSTRWSPSDSRAVGW